jgi:hypothetical protein
MEPNNATWVEKYAHTLNDSGGDLSKLSSDERKHLRLLLQQYELEQRLTNVADALSQGKLPLAEEEDN